MARFIFALTWFFAWATSDTSLISSAPAQSTDKSPSPGYQKTAPLFEGMGDHQFRVSTRVALAQKYFDQGLVLAYAFNHLEAARSFREAQKLDAKCAMAYWGEAFALGPNINAAMEDADVPRAWRALQLAKRHAANGTDRERDYVLALEKRYAEKVVKDRAPLNKAYADAMRKLAAKYPNDYDAASLFADALMNISPWDYWLEGGRPKPLTKELLATLERVLARRPNHPLANHLYIHAVEAAHPEWAEACADRLRDLVPGAGHLVHMPSHVYIRVGRYADASDVNESAIKVDDDYVTQCRAQGLYPLAYAPHNRHFLWFSASMEGRSEVSIRAARHIGKHADRKKMRKSGLETLQHFYAMPLFALARFGRWDEVLREPRPDADLKYPTGVWHYVQGLALLRKKKPDEAQKHLTALSKLADDESLDKVKIWNNNSTRHILRVAEQVLAGEAAAARKDFKAAAGHLRKAVELDDAMTYDEPQLWYVPTRQTLGAVLLDARQFAEAGKTFRQDLSKYPANGWSLFGMYQALSAQKKDGEAARYKAEFDKAWRRADVKLQRPGF